MYFTLIVEKRWKVSLGCISVIDAFFNAVTGRSRQEVGQKGFEATDCGFELQYRLFF